MAQEEKGVWAFIREHWTSLFWTVAMGPVVAFMGYLIMTSDGKNPRETLYQTILFTAASVIASWQITRIYSSMQANQVWRDHGVQIAGGIMVMRHQLNHLGDWVSEKRGTIAKDSSSIDADPILEHVEETIMSFQGMADTALRGIAGTIGDALGQYESVMEQISRVRLGAIEKTTRIQEEMQSAVSIDEIEKLEAKIKEISIKTQEEISSLARKTAFPIPEFPSPTLKNFSHLCPFCGKECNFELRERPGETRVIRCRSCGGAFNVHLQLGNNIIARPVGTVGSLSQSHGSQFQAEARAFLGKTDAWVDPSIVLIIINLIEGHDQIIKKSCENKTARILLKSVLSESEKLTRYGIAKSSIRKVFKLLYKGRVYKFSSSEVSEVSGYDAVYVNDLDQESLIMAYLRGCLLHLSSGFKLKPDKLSDLSHLLLANKFENGDQLVERAIAQIAALAPTSEGSRESGEKSHAPLDKPSGVSPE